MLASSASVIGVMDADMQHDEAILPQLWNAIARGECDLAVGSRSVQGGGMGEWNQKRQSISRGATWLAGLFSKLTSRSDEQVLCRLTDGFRSFTAEAVDDRVQRAPIAADKMPTLLEARRRQALRSTISRRIGQEIGAPVRSDIGSGELGPARTSELSQAMATERQIAVNRKNALRSKGPSSRAGIARAARNAYRHGLAATPGAIVLRRVEELAKEIAGPSAGYVQHAMACEAAHAAIDLARVRQAKVAIFNRAVVAERGEVSDPIAKANSPATADAAALMARAASRFA